MNDQNENVQTAFAGIQLGKHSRESVCDVHGDYTENGGSLRPGNIIWHGCSLCSQERAKKAQERKLIEEQIRAQQQLESRLNKAGIPIRFRERTLDNFIVETPQQNAALTVSRDFVESFDDNYKSGRTLIFSGKAGTGKSHLATAIAQAVMPKYTAMYLNALDAIRMIRDTWRKDSEKSELDVLNLLGSVDLLVIDEVGVQSGTDNEQMLMFDIINRRYRDSKPMILLTNLGTAGFSEYLTERSYDRLRENGKWVSFEWPSYRGKVRAAA